MTADRAKGLSGDEQQFVRGEPGRTLAAIQATGCPAPALLRAAAVDALPAEMLGAVHAHVGACAICRQLTADLLEVDTDIDMLEEARIRRRLQRARKPAIWQMAAIAATLVLAAGAAMLMAPLTSVGPVPSAASAPRRIVRPPSVSVLSPAKLAPRLDASALLWRGSGDRFSTDLALALKPYAENDFKTASAALERLSSQYPDKAEPAVYLGICRLLMDRPVDAEKALRRATALGGPMLDDARWYLSVAVYQNGRRSEARQLLADMCHQNSAHAAEACLAQDQIGDTK